MIKRIIGACLLVLGAVVFVACGAKRDPFPCGANTLGQLGDVSYTRDIAAILADSCLRCHDQTNTGTARNGAPVGVDFDTTTGASTWSDRIVARASAQTMPPDAGHVGLMDRCRLLAWQQGGFRE